MIPVVIAERLLNIGTKYVWLWKDQLGREKRDSCGLIRNIYFCHLWMCHRRNGANILFSDPSCHRWKGFSG